MNKTPRVMWLLNHTTLREFEVQQFRRMGITEIFLPKRFPYDEANLSASVTFAMDVNLQIPQEELSVLNAQDWYAEPAEQAWEIANRYFDLVIVGFFMRQIESAVRYFDGAIVMRAFGLSGGETYSGLIRKYGGEPLDAAIRKCGKRFWFGMGYKHLTDIELPYVADRSIYLPVGLKREEGHFDAWEGKEKQIFFVCPRIGTSPYFNEVYKEFRKNFGDMNYIIAGAQPVEVADPKIIGFVPQARHEYNMKQSRVMFYHSREPYHIHFHPFEAIRGGMPLVFMAGGMLDRLGGAGLPGRCETMQEARKMIERILNDDMDLIHQIRSSQSVMLHAVASEDLELEWRTGLARILDELTASRSALAARPSINRRKRIAVIVPIGYRGGTLRGAQLLAEAIFLGSRQAEEPVDVVLVHRDMPEYYPEEEFAGLPSEIARRTFNWKIMNQSEARRAMRYAGFSGWEPSMQQYQVPDDGIQQLQDCDLWLFVSDRLSLPVLPLKPIALMVYDYLQRYVDILPHEMNMSFLDAARQAQRIFVTTDFNFCDAVQYAGLDPQKVCKVPMLTPDFGGERRDQSRSEYFIWTTNPALHKNHARAAEALRIYYDELDGQLDCWVTGADTYRILEGGASYLDDVSKIFERSPSLRSHVHWRGELSDAAYRHCLGGASFLWHAGRVDNGTFSVVEAAHMGVPALSSDYPAMKEMDARFSLNLAWMNPYSPRHMAEQLKKMEKEVELRQSMLPSAEQLDQQGLEVLALCYWEELRKCL